MKGGEDRMSEKVEKIRNFIDLFSPLLKLSLLAIFIISIFVIFDLKDDCSIPTVYKGRTIQERQFLIQEYIEQIYKEAKEKDDYSPKDYFEDLLRRQNKEKELQISSCDMTWTHKLFGYARDSFDSNSAYWDEVEKQQKIYSPIIDKNDWKKEKMDFSKTPKRLLIFYLFNLLVAFLFFIVTIIKRDH